MAWTLPVYVEKEYGPTDRIYVYDADKRCVLRMNRTDNPHFDYVLACEVANAINEWLGGGT